MIRILNVIGRRPTGGIGAVVTNYQSNFPEEIVFDYLLFSDDLTGEFDNHVKEMGSKVFVLPALKSSRFISINQQIKQFFTEVKNEYDIVHIHTVNIAFLVARYARKNGINHIIAHSHATKFSDKKVRAIRNQILCLDLKNICTDFVACSYEAGQFLYGNQFMKTGKVRIIKNAINVEKYSFSEAKRTRFREDFKLDDEIIFSNIGRLSVQKNQSFLIDIYREIEKEIPNSKLFIVGDGEEKSKLVKKVQDLNLQNNIIFTGKRNDIDEILSGVDVLLMPSLYEGLPVIGVEALASGLLCIFSDSISKEFNSKNSFYVSLQESAATWAKQTISITSRTNSRKSLAKEMGYDITEEAPKLIEFYKEIVEK
ncbi:glycosyltransferase [Enterococcus asini]|uniref:glycosyltransferase n=1 Tax=Enterococcus asini TaxID=57732 RepID=UPI0028924762|nr:glycosyltransferase [Enterococcus asini]MDT2785388.1 glycosyltransferase [Enterococcus asini]